MTTKPKAKSAATPTGPKAAAKDTSAETVTKTETAKSEPVKAAPAKAAATEPAKIVAETKPSAPEMAVPEKAVTEQAVVETEKAVKETEKAVAEVSRVATEAGAVSEMAAQTGADAIIRGLEQAMLIAKQQAEKASELAAKNLEDVSQASMSTYDTWLKSGETLAKGLEQVNKTVLAYVQDCVDANVKAGKDMMACTTLADLWSVQSSHAKASFDGLLAESTKVSEMTAATLGEAFGPITAQFKDAFGQAWKPASY